MLFKCNPKGCKVGQMFDFFYIALVVYLQVEYTNLRSKNTDIKFIKSSTVSMSA